MNQLFENTTFDQEHLPATLEQEYSHCIFRKCDLTNAGFLSTRLEDCTFDSCNLSMVKFNGTVLNDIQLANCKVVGVDFSKCSKMAFSLKFENCILDYAIFHKNNLKNFMFTECRMNGTSFLETNLTSVKFIRCDLEKAAFERSNLEKADFTSSRNYTINPETNKLKKTKFSLPDVVGLLGNLDIIIE
ncbi:MAG TPA: pentapeptide repeat-containing protein [Bacteroidota bacterium]|nr:pentapeptide repeat-containing protein [Bacteroidota bacterium]